MCIGRFYLYYLCITVVNSEIVTLVRNNSIICVATEDDIYSALYLYPVVSNVNLKRRNVGSVDWGADWKNEPLNMGIITDRRWQEFTIHQNELRLKLKQNTTFGISLCTNEKNTVNISLTNESVIFTNFNTTQQHTSEKWNHYKLEVSKNNHRLQVQLHDQLGKIIQTQNFKNSTVYLNTGVPSYWKLHKLQVRHTSFQSNSSEIQVKILQEGEFVLSMFVNLSRDSRLTVYEKTSLEPKQYNSTWKIIELPINLKKHATVRIYVECLDVRSTCSASISGIEVYLSQMDTSHTAKTSSFLISISELNSVIVNSHTNATLTCKALNETESKGVIEPKPCARGLVGLDCNLKCSKILQKVPKRCESKKNYHNCYLEQCEPGWKWWKPNCKNEKCTKCEDEYTGVNCYSKHPPSTGKPRLTDITNPSTTSEVNNTENGTNKTKPNDSVESTQVRSGKPRLTDITNPSTTSEVNNTENGTNKTKPNDSVESTQKNEFPLTTEQPFTNNCKTISLSTNYLNTTTTTPRRGKIQMGPDNKYSKTSSLRVSNTTPLSIPQVRKRQSTTTATTSVMQRPSKLSLHIKGKQALLTWKHESTNNFSIIISRNGTMPKQYDNISGIIRNKTMQQKNKRSFSLPIQLEFDIEYIITVWPVGYDKENSTIRTFLTKSSSEFEWKPFITLCENEQCRLLIPKPSIVENMTTNFTISVKQKSGNKYWNVTELSTENNYLTAKIGNAPVYAVSPNNQSYTMSLLYGNYVFHFYENPENSSFKAAFLCLFIIIIIAGSSLGYLIYAYKNNKYPLDFFRHMKEQERSLLNLEMQNFSEHYKKTNMRTIREKCPASPIDIQVPNEERVLPSGSCENNLILAKPVHINKFEDYLMAALENDPYNNELTRQYKNLQKRKIAKSCIVGHSEANMKKNRFKNMAAYDQSRVKLENNANSDYINANYVHGYENPKAFIATQAPLKTTLSDFWWMIWQENATYIVMVTELEESGIVKCEKYWPEPALKIRFGKILITNLSEKYFSDYVHRLLKVECDEASRSINHLHYTTWPDHGVPPHPQNFTPFIKRVLALPQNHPIIVHCSAGCGRTGTLILCDILLRKAAKEQQVDFVKVLSDIRQYRHRLVNNMDQYVFAHFVVLDCLFGVDFSIPINNSFQDAIDKVLRKTTVKPLLLYLEKNDYIYSKLQPKISTALTDDQKKKNRFSNVLPGLSRLYLPVTADNSSQYINAVSVNCYRCPNKFIVTQLPLPNTIDDFWTLIKEYEINTIVCLNEIDSHDTTCPKFWSFQSQSTNLHLVEDIDGKVYYITKLKITDSSNHYNEKIVNVLRMKNWKPDACKPRHVKALIDLWKEMFNTSWRGNSQIVVTCYDGATASGLFVALAYLLEKMNYEQICDVFSAVRTVRQSRVHFVQDWAQLEFLYKAAKVYIEEFDNYDNFD